MQAPQRRRVADKATQASKTYLRHVGQQEVAPTAPSMKYLTLRLTAEPRSSRMPQRRKDYCPQWPGVKLRYIQAVLTQPAVATSSNYHRFSFTSLGPITPQRPKGMWPCDRATSTSAGQVKKRKRKKRLKVSERLPLAEILILFSLVGSAVKAWGLSVLAPPAGNGSGSPVMDRFEESEKYKSHLFYSQQEEPGPHKAVCPVLCSWTPSLPVNEWPCMPHTSGCWVLVKKGKKKTVVGLIALKTMNQPVERMRKNLVAEGDIVLALNVKWQMRRLARVKLLKTKGQRFLHWVSQSSVCPQFFFFLIYTRHDSTAHRSHCAHHNSIKPGHELWLCANEKMTVDCFAVSVSQL